MRSALVLVLGSWGCTTDPIVLSVLRAELEVTPAELDLGVVTPGGTREGQVRLGNVGRLPLRLTGEPYVDDVRSGFVLTGRAPEVLAPGALAELTVHFRGADPPGPSSAQLMIQADDREEPRAVRLAARSEAVGCPTVQERHEELCEGAWCWANPSPTGRWLHSVWASAADDVWVAGGELVLRFDGVAWRSVPGLQGNVVWGTGPADVWIAAGETVHHFDGRAWSEGRAPFPVEMLSGSPTAGLFAAARQGLLRAGAAGWERFQPAPPLAGITALHIDRSDSIWVAGVDPFSGTSIHRWQGSSWSEVWRSPDNVAIISTFDDGSGTTWFGGLRVRGGAFLGRWDGAAFLTPEVDASLLPEYGVWSIWGAAPDDVWFAGGNDLLHFDGAAFTPAPRRGCAPAPLRFTDTLVSVFGVAPDQAWAVGDPGVILAYDGTAWRRVTGGPSGRLLGLFARAADEAWAVGEGRVLLRFDGRSWSRLEVGPGPSLDFADVWAAAPDDVWLAGSAGLEHFDGTALRPVGQVPPGDYRGIWGTGPEDIWLVGAGGAVLHRGAAGWIVVPSPTGETLLDVAGSAGVVWAAGGRSLLRLEPAAALLMPAPPTSLAAIQPLSPEILLAASAQGVLRFAAGHWSLDHPSSELRALWSNGQGGLWAVGQEGVLSLGDSGWTVRLSLGTPRAVHGAPGGRVWVAGESGHLLGSAP